MGWYEECNKIAVDHNESKILFPATYENATMDPFT